MTHDGPARASRTARGRTIELVLAHAHLRLGSLALARVELETLAGLAGLDTIGLVDLGRGALADRRPARARARRRRPRWPAAATTRSRSSSRPRRRHRSDGRARPGASRRARSPGRPARSTRSSPGCPARASGRPMPTSRRRPRRPCSIAARRSRSVSHAGESSAAAGRDGPCRPPRRPATPVNLGFWDAEDGGGRRGHVGPRSGARVRARADRPSSRVPWTRPRFRFGLALRLAPALAPAVLEATEGARAANLMVVRGDAYRLAGHEPEARQAYAIAANGGLPERRSRVRQRPRVKPVVVDDDDAHRRAEPDRRRDDRRRRRPHACARTTIRTRSCGTRPRSTGASTASVRRRRPTRTAAAATATPDGDRSADGTGSVRPRRGPGRPARLIAARYPIQSRARPARPYPR